MTGNIHSMAVALADFARLRFSKICTWFLLAVERSCPESVGPGPSTATPVDDWWKRAVRRGGKNMKVGIDMMDWCHGMSWISLVKSCLP